jgi:DnaJ homolog subfamily C member 19
MKLLLIIGAGLVLWWLWRNMQPRTALITRADAARLLGISVDADVEMIISAHKRLIAKVHPDAGGSAELASQINRARDTLLKTLSQ